jgi:hypothetical protein
MRTDRHEANSRFSQFLRTRLKMGTVVSLFESKERVCDSDRPLTLSSADVRDAWSYTSTPKYAFMLWCLIKHRTYLYLARIMGQCQGLLLVARRKLKTRVHLVLRLIISGGVPSRLHIPLQPAQRQLYIHVLR